MVMQADIQRASQRLEPGALVQLFIVDLTPIGVNQQWAFCPSGNCTFGGVDFVYADVEADGFEWAGKGTLPQPTVKISNATRFVSGIAKEYDDLIGAKFTRIKTYSQFLDGGAEENSAAMFAPDIYVFEQKTKHTKFQVEWKLSAAMDQQGVELPGRTIIRDYCLWRYRVWKGDHFDYTGVQCPYQGSRGSFDENGAPTTSDNDTPSRRFDTCCKKRFGPNANYPFGGFPGVSRMRA
ncbi:phage minor tail protein L (plasmid) [Rhizobium bangladeshense]|uniref:phage minor tail protein L n=1 Tax=Rhizobium bangladeshense TaxID=1138189 RepID=UPI001A994FF5|nr:phage minor tail protein L [Rhizobium bangladeshense]QSY98658.1 phage minor tail protein L [Rhizobium bangladeshense]